ncbi:MAG: hypothetical protein RLZZ540_2167 [Bacteroidota bacterium]|jgi:hypothetical protein
MRYPFLYYFGGFLWWLLIRFCKTNLEDEQAEDKRIRNIVFSIALGMIIAFVSIKNSKLN